MTTTELRNEAELDQESRKRNAVLLIVLLALIGGLMLASGPLFNNYWDPAESAKTISH